MGCLKPNRAVRALMVISKRSELEDVRRIVRLLKFLGWPALRTWRFVFSRFGLFLKDKTDLCNLSDQQAKEFLEFLHTQSPCKEQSKSSTKRDMVVLPARIVTSITFTTPLYELCQRLSQPVSG